MPILLYAQLKIPPGLTFRTYETPHFLIHYHRGTEDWVPRVAHIAESLYSEYSKVFSWKPSKINLVLLDAYDFSNGMTTPIFENTVYLYLQPPVGEPYFGSMEGWLELLLSHELVHVFHLDKPHPIWGIPYPEMVRWVFGRNPLMCAFPNLLDPPWQIEGIATYYESKGGYGRLNNRYFTDQMLAYVRDGGALSPDLMSMPVDVWPFGRAYLWGSLYLQYLARRYGEGKMVDRVVNSSYLEDPITFCSYGCVPGPYLWRDMSDFSLWKRDLVLKALDVQKGDYRYITRLGNEKGHLALSPSGRYVAYTESTPYEYPSLKVVRLEDGKVVRRVKALAVGPVSWAGDTVVLFSQYEVHRNFYVFSDLYALDLRSGEVRRLTKGERAHSPVATPYGVLYVRREGPRQSIVRYGGEVIYRGKEGEGFTDLHFHGDTLYFTLYHHGWLNVAYLPYGGDSVHLLTHTRDPSLLSYVGDSGILFTENFTPYLIRDGEVRKLMDNPLSVLYPQPYGDSLILLVMGGRGLDVAVAPVRSEPASLPKDFRREVEVPPVPLSSSRPYNPLPHLLPKFWQPLIFSYADTGNFTLSGGLMTAGGDVLYRHTYSLTYVGGITFEEAPSPDTSLFHNLDLYYTYDGLPPTLGLHLNTGVLTDANAKLRDYSVEVEPSVLLPFNRIDGWEYLSFGAFARLMPGGRVWSVSVGGGVSRAYSYKRTSNLIADGFLLKGAVHYGGGWGASLSGALAVRKGILLNLKLVAFALPYRVSLSPYVYPPVLLSSDTLLLVSLAAYPDIFSPNFPEINRSLVPPSPWAFFSYLSLARVYPGVAVEYAHYSAPKIPLYVKDTPHLILLMNSDLVLYGFPLTLSVGYEVYPVKGLRITLR